RRRHTRFSRDWSSDVCSSDLKNINYSEAFAGSGETAIVILVHKIFNATNESLILLDEPETSLHSGAQKRLMSFLIEQCIKKKHQIGRASCREGVEISQRA